MPPLPPPRGESRSSASDTPEPGRSEAWPCLPTPSVPSGEPGTGPLVDARLESNNAPDAEGEEERPCGDLGRDQEFPGLELEARRLRWFGTDPQEGVGPDRQQRSGERQTRDEPLGRALG